MVVLRPTRKLRSALPMSADALRTSDTALGDWYVNRIVVDRRPLLLLVSSTSLLPILVPARAVRGLPARLASVVDARLRRLGLNDRLIVSETGAMETVMIGPTIDRSVLGIMVDFAKGLSALPRTWAVGRDRAHRCRAASGRNAMPRVAAVRTGDIPRQQGPRAFTHAMDG